MIRYTLLRFLVFFGCLGLLWLAGLRDRDEQVWLLLGSAVLSVLISAFALRRFRDEMTADLQRKLEERQARRGVSDEEIEDGLTEADRAQEPEQYR